MKDACEGIPTTTEKPDNWRQLNFIPLDALTDAHTHTHTTHLAYLVNHTTAENTVTVLMCSESPSTQKQMYCYCIYKIKAVQILNEAVLLSNDESRWLT